MPDEQVPPRNILEAGAAKVFPDLRAGGCSAVDPQVPIVQMRYQESALSEPTGGPLQYSELVANVVQPVYASHEIGSCWTLRDFAHGSCTH